MSIRTTVTAGTWTQIGTGPAIVQVISPGANGVSVMVANQTSAPATNSDGVVLNAQNQIQRFGVAQTIWAQCVNPTQTAIMAVQPDVVGGG